MARPVLLSLSLNTLTSPTGETTSPLTRARQYRVSSPIGRVML